MRATSAVEEVLFARTLAKNLKDKNFKNSTSFN